MIYEDECRGCRWWYDSQKMRLHTVVAIVLVGLLAPAVALGDEAKAPQAKMAASVTQYGITWQFDKEYPTGLYAPKFALYVDKIVERIDLQTEAYGKEKNLPPQLFEVYSAQKAELAALKQEHGPIVQPDQLG